MIIARCDSAVYLEMADHALDAVALAIEALAVVNRCCAVGLRWNDSFDAPRLEIIADCIGIIGFVGEQRARGLLR